MWTWTEVSLSDLWCACIASAVAGWTTAKLIIYRAKGARR